MCSASTTVSDRTAPCSTPAPPPSPTQPDPKPHPVTVTAIPTSGSAMTASPPAARSPCASTASCTTSASTDPHRNPHHPAHRRLGRAHHPRRHRRDPPPPHPPPPLPRHRPTTRTTTTTTTTARPLMQVRAVRDVLRHHRAPSAGFEPAHTAPETVTQTSGAARKERPRCADSRGLRHHRARPRKWKPESERCAPSGGRPRPTEGRPGAKSWLPRACSRTRAGAAGRPCQAHESMLGATSTRSGEHPCVCGTATALDL